MQGQDPYGAVLSGSLEIRTGPLIGVQTYVDARTLFRNLEEAVFTLNFDSAESKRSRGLWYSLRVHGFCGGPAGSKTQGLVLQVVSGAIKGRFRRADIFKSYTEPEYSIDGAIRSQMLSG